MKTYQVMLLRIRSDPEGTGADLYHASGVLSWSSFYICNGTSCYYADDLCKYYQLHNVLTPVSNLY